MFSSLYKVSDFMDKVHWSALSLKHYLHCCIHFWIGLAFIFFFWKGTCIHMNEMECMELHARASEPHSWENKCGNLPIQENWVITWPYTASDCNPRMCGNLPIQENWVITWPYTASDCNPRMWIEANRFSSHCLTLISIDSECGGDTVPSFVENNRVPES